MNRSLIVACLFLLVFSGVVFAWQQQEESKPRTLPQDPDLIARRDFMRSKLMYSQLVLEGLTTDNFEMVDQAIENLQMVTEGEMWVAFDDDDDYRKLTQDFKTATSRMAEAAATKNLDATAMRFYQMNTSCIDCHKHIRAQGYKL